MAYVPPHKRRSAGAVASASRETPPSTHDDQHNSNVERCDLCDAFHTIRCINLQSRPEQWQRFLYHAQRIGPSFVQKVRRFHAVDGRALLSPNEDGDPTSPIPPEVSLEWDTTKNALWDKHVQSGMTRQMTAGEVGCAMSHVTLWRELVNVEGKNNEQDANMLILEDDAAFLHQKAGMYQARAFSQGRGKRSPVPVSANRFKIAFREACNLLPNNKWDVFYLGFSARGERKDSRTSQSSMDPNVTVELFRPTYGYHTHAYALTQSAAKILLDNLPISGPIDVWLADNEWFGLRVYCAHVTNDGWQNLGAPLICQDRVQPSSIGQSGRGC